jgi:hypothetical protein
MITCEHARHLFDRYLDGELSSSLQAELHAHQLSCPACQSELAMLEACGAVIALDRREPRLSASFTDRVLLARRAQTARRPRRWTRIAVIAGSPLAAAASIALLLVTVSAPNTTTPNHSGNTATLGKQEAVSTAAQKAYGLSDEQKDRLANMEQMTGGFMNDVLEQVLTNTQQNRESLRGSLGGMELLLRQAVNEAHDRLVTPRFGTSPAPSVAPTPSAESPVEELDPVAPPLYFQFEQGGETAPETPSFDQPI